MLTMDGRTTNRGQAKPWVGAERHPLGNSAKSSAPLQIFRHPTLKFQPCLLQIIPALFHELPETRIFSAILSVDSGAEGEQSIQQRFGCILISIQ
jgi:hypothetical protein